MVDAMLASNQAETGSVQVAVLQAMKYYVIRNDPDSGQRMTVNEEELRVWEGRAILNANGSQYGCWKRLSGPYDDPAAAMHSYWDKEKIKQIHGYV